jgi:hypothetical protein
MNIAAADNDSFGALGKRSRSPVVRVQRMDGTLVQGLPSDASRFCGILSKRTRSVPDGGVIGQRQQCAPHIRERQCIGVPYQQYLSAADCLGTLCRSSAMDLQHNDIIRETGPLRLPIKDLDAAVFMVNTIAYCDLSPKR